MKKNLTILCCIMLFWLGTSAQKVAMDFNRNNCNSTNNHLYSDLDSGKAVVLFYYMPNCGSCVPPSKAVQKMLSNLNQRFPNMVKAYVMPYNNSTKCMDVSNWVMTNGLSLFTPMDSGATQVAYYGGMGMPSIVLVGGTDHRVLFTVNQDRSFKTSDTTIMRDSILTLFGVKTGISNEKDFMPEVKIFPNPSSDNISIRLTILKQENLSISVLDVMGRKVADLMNAPVMPGYFEKGFALPNLPSGNYFVQVRLGENQQTLKLQL